HLAQKYLHMSHICATIQAYIQLLPGSCNFESNTCGYTSDTDFMRWTLHKDGLFFFPPFLAHTCLKIALLLQPVSLSVFPLGNVNHFLFSCFHPCCCCCRLVKKIRVVGALMVCSAPAHLFSSLNPLFPFCAHCSTSDALTQVKPSAPAPITAADFSFFLHPDCDFEESHLCGYSNQWNANVNWYVGGGGAQLLQNSMPNDHTYNNRTGQIMYVDSIYAKTFKEVAKLVSPMTTVPMSGCLNFQYQRSEEGGNLFSVFTRDRLGQYQELWRAGSENQSEWSEMLGEWIPVQVDLKAPYSVVFEVAFNSPRGGRVALDDISFSPEFCSTDTEPTFDPSIANCDFESGLCQYTQDQVMGSSWRRVSVKPNIFRNGDHTTGAGSFLLAHSWLSPRSGYMSRLISPTLPGNMKYCLRFYFSLRGYNQTDQALAVYLQQSSSQEKIWTQGERSRGIWIATDITFQTSQPAKVVFISTCRSFWDCGSVALDDISVSLGDCELTAGLLSSPLPGHCDFETGLCGYTQDKDTDAGDWEWRRGPTPTSYTGPRGDHTTGLGYYLHMEASSMLPGQSVRLLSRPLRGSRGPQCLRFYYHMYGSSTGQLSVHLDKDGEDVLLWQRSGEQSIAWLRARVEYQCDSQHQIVFEATRGSSVRSDIAIDDIVLEGGPCPGKLRLRIKHPTKILKQSGSHLRSVAAS
uniref:MAM domain-containing protein n=1 Tax=Seriola lalandi dorsalis TaxID=1841481 RepID=A0A3B4XNT8_SERLL